MRVILSENPEATRALARSLARDLHPPVVIALYGDLGAGKTLFTQALAQALGITQPVTSPTFTLINEYDLPDGGKLYHVDCYRLHDPIPEAIGLGLEELFEEGIVVIEWADRIEPLLPAARIDVHLEHAGEDKRRILVHDRRTSTPAPSP
ncbi:MAG TPA: tRNA (adenosine(37)-N6)-threonylcarbamoyltransferase complex ATPase subunit type 1 TsaE [Anaerolineae bacterium]|nr:tRNA (adenosine(37)-N6)-threonylcarbamoyltransferase complex ATPase subunit type 1 TsaE [Anaerolineae bacterium]